MVLSNSDESSGESPQKKPNRGGRYLDCVTIISDESDLGEKIFWIYFDSH